VKTISTLLKRVLFAGVCLVSWTILPVLLVVGGLALFLYALAAESLHSLTSRQPKPDGRPASKVADEMGRTAPQRPASS
jgi:hypothetical protein